MQTLLKFWDGGIIATGGLLEASKTFWYMIDFTWETGDWKYKNTYTENTQLHMKSSHGEQVTIEKVNVENSGSKTSTGW
jgi:hypothetical protein